MITSLSLPTNPKIGLWKSSLQLSRKDEVLLTWCRIGHSRVTHSLLLNNEPVPERVFCACPLTIRHVLLECADLILMRQQYFRTTSLSDLFLGVERAASPWPTLGIRSGRTFCSDLA